MSTSQNYPNIVPSLSLDFASVKKLDPRVTFARASTARVYDGKTVAKAEENLLLRSQDYSATWVATNLTPVTGKTAPDATATATEFTASAGNATLTQSFTAVAGDYTFSVFLRRVTGTGDVDISAHSGGTWVTQTLTSTWTRFTVTQTLTAGARTPGVRVVTSGDAIEVWGAQIEFRASATAYTPTTTQPITNYIPVLQSAANNVARFDHNPVTGESLGLLVEEQRTNLVTYSEAFDDASWTKFGATVTANAVVAPDGMLTGDALIETTANEQHRASQAVTVAATTYTATVYAKAAGRTRFRIASFSGLIPGAEFDLATVTATPTGATSSASITPVGNGWFRCAATRTLTAGSDSFLVGLVSGSLVSYTGDGTSGIYIWGAQLEAGAFPTSYIPTVASQVTRSADAASMTGANFSSWYRADEGTIYAENQRPLGSRGSVSFDNGTDSQRITLSNNIDNSNTALVVVNGILQTNNTFGTNTAQFAKFSMSYRFNDIASAQNAGTVNTASTASIPVVNQMRLGVASGGPGQCFYKKVAYYPARLTNANLQALTS